MATLEAGDVGGDAQMGYELIVQQTKLPEGLVGVENVDAKVDALAVMIIEAGKLQPGQEVLVWFDKDVAVLAGRVAEMAGEVAGNVKFYCRDLDADAAQLAAIGEMCDPSDVEFCVEAMYAEERGLFEDLERKGGKVLMMRVEEEGQISRAVSERPDLEEAYRAAYVKYNANPRSKGLVGWTLFMWPSGQEAEHEGMSHKDYFDFVVKACDQEWGKIWKAQELLKLKLDGAKVIKFVADGTDVEVGIEGFTFLNSTVDTNAPGAELYTAPEIGKVNGNIFAKGKRQYQGHVMEDITLRIEKGRVVEASARVGDEHLQKILDSDEGSRYFGEVAIGGNPGIMKRLMSIMYSEKMGASFHMALGDAYSDKNGVKLDNGNRSVVHWDLVISMRPEDGGGQVWVDGELIQEDGIYLDPRLSALNRRDPEDEA